MITMVDPEALDSNQFFTNVRFEDIEISVLGAYIYILCRLTEL